MLPRALNVYLVLHYPYRNYSAIRAMKRLLTADGPKIVDMEVKKKS